MLGNVVVITTKTVNLASENFAAHSLSAVQCLRIRRHATLASNSYTRAACRHPNFAVLVNVWNPNPNVAQTDSQGFQYTARWTQKQMLAAASLADYWPPLAVLSSITAVSSSAHWHNAVTYCVCSLIHWLFSRLHLEFYIYLDKILRLLRDFAPRPRGSVLGSRCQTPVPQIIRFGELYDY